MASLLLSFVAMFAGLPDAASIATPDHSPLVREPDTVRRALVWGCCMQTVGVSRLPAEVASAVTDFLSRSKTYRSRLRPSGRRTPIAREVFGKKQALERTVFALFQGRTIAVSAAEFAESVSPSYEWEGFSGGPLGEMAGAEKFLSRHPTTPIRPYVLLLVAHRSICALEALEHELKYDRGARAWNLAQQATLRKRLPEALGEASRSSHPLIRFVAADIERTPGCITD